MKIQIFERCTPFSHKPGISCLIPGTREIIRAFPGKINDDLLEVAGPIKEWTFFQDLERARIQVKGIAQNGVFKKEFSGTPLPSKAKLSFGSHKAQNMNKMVERADPAEFLPLWFALAQYYPDAGTFEAGDSLLNDVKISERLDLYQAWKNLFLSGFSEWMIPRNFDEGYHGFSKPPVMGNDPFQMFTVGAVLIKEMFVKFDGSQLCILPRLPPELHCGRLVNLEVPGLGTISIEWSKKEIKKIILNPSVSIDLLIVHPKRIQGCRLKVGNRTSRQTIEKLIKLEKNEVIFFDQFQH